MCLAVVGAILAVGQAAAGFAGASAQADAQNEFYMQNAREAQRAATVQYTNLSIRRDQTLESANNKLFDQSIEALKARGTANTAAGEAGVGGNTVDDLINDLFAQEGRRSQALDTQFKMDAREIQTQMDNSQGQAQQRINSVQRAEPPSPLSFIIQGASGAVGAFTKGGNQGKGTT